MNVLRRSWSQFALLLLGILGIADSIYLTLVHYDEQVQLACPDKGFVNCARVITSKYSYVPGTTLPISLPGLAWCLVVVALALVGIFLGTERRWLRWAQFIWTSLGMLTVFYLFYVEMVLLDNICAWCTVLHILILLMFLITLAHLRARPAYDEELEYEDEVDENEGGQAVPVHS